MRVLAALIVSVLFYGNALASPVVLYDMDNQPVGTSSNPLPVSFSGDQVISGNVGIGSTSPRGKLDVDGGIYVSGSANLGSGVATINSDQQVLETNGVIRGAIHSGQESRKMAGFVKSVLGDNAVGIWSMAEASTPTSDATIYGHDLTWTNFISTDHAIYGSSFVMSPDGTTKRLYSADADDLSFGATTSDSAFTVGAWVEISATDQVKNIISKYDTGIPAKEWALFFSVGQARQPKFRLTDNNVNKNCDVYPSTPVAAGFHFVVATYSGLGGATAGNGVVIYIDGVAVAVTVANDASYVAMEPLTSQLSIGSLSASGVGSSFYPDDIGLVFLSRTALSEQSVNTLYQATRGYYNK